MNINPIRQNNNNTVFKAKVIETMYVDKFLGCMLNKSNAKEQLNLWKSVENAISKHPSEKVIFTYIESVSKQNKGVKGVIKTRIDKHTNTDASKSIYNAVWDIWKEILNPKNEEAFHKIFGKEYAPQYKMWWEENVAPFWDKLSKIH